MTDRARVAYQTIDTFGWRIEWPHEKPVPDDAWPIDIIRRQMEEEVRERTARLRAVLVEARMFAEWPAGAENERRVLKLIDAVLGTG